MRGYLAKLFDSGARPVKSPAVRSRAPEKRVEKTVQARVDEEAPKPQQAMLKPVEPLPALEAPVKLAPIGFEPESQRPKIVPAAAETVQERPATREPALTESLTAPKHATHRQRELTAEPTQTLVEVERVVEVPGAIEKADAPRIITVEKPAPAEQRNDDKPVSKTREWVRPPMLGLEKREPAKPVIQPEPQRVSKPASQQSEKPSAVLDFDVSDEDALDDRVFESLHRMKRVHAPPDFVRDSSARAPEDDTRSRADAMRARGQTPSSAAHGLTIHKLDIEIVERPRPEAPAAPAMAPQPAAAAIWDWPDRRNWRQVR